MYSAAGSSPRGHPERSGAKRNAVEGPRGITSGVALTNHINLTPRDPSTSLGMTCGVSAALQALQRA